MAGNREKPEKPPEWLDLTFVRLANSLPAKMGDGQEKGHDAFTAVNGLTGRVANWVASRFLDRRFEKAAARRLGELEKARVESAGRFAKAMPDCRRLTSHADQRGYGCSPADPALVLRVFCNVVIRVHTSLPEAGLSDVALGAFRTVALPQLHAHLSRIEACVAPGPWPALLNNDGVQQFNGSWAPMEVARLVAEGKLERRHFDSSSPKLCPPRKLKDGDEDIGREKDATKAEARRAVLRAAGLLHMLLRKAARSDAAWNVAKRMAGEYVALEEESGQQVVTGLGSSQLEFSSMNLMELCDRAHFEVISSLGGRTVSMLGKSFPQIRRQILAYASQAANPTEAEIKGDFAGSVERLGERLQGIDDRLPELSPSECLAYAYHVSKRTAIRLGKDGKVEADAVRLKASLLTCDLLRSAAEAEDRDIRNVALRYLAGYITNPRYLCGADDFRECHKWIARYEKAEPASLLAKHFRARHMLASGNKRDAEDNYRVLFVRAMPVGELRTGPSGPIGVVPAKGQSQQLTDMECISYLLPECYALAGSLLDEKQSPADDETAMQRDIRRISEAHFGVSCADWRREETSIIAGFELRSRLLGSK